jgi:putative molybdenum carrier protein
MAKRYKIISGGQTGVDQAALRAAQKCGLICGGWCPPGRECESGMIPAEFPLQETPSDRSTDAPEIPRSQRTVWNVRDSDATLILPPQSLGEQDPGPNLTKQCAVRYGRPLLVCDPWDRSAQAKVEQWLQAHPIEILNVAGPSEETITGIGDRVYELLALLFSECSNKNPQANLARRTD